MVNSRLKRMGKSYRHMPKAGQPLGIGRVTEEGRDRGDLKQSRKRTEENESKRHSKRWEQRGNSVDLL